MTETTNTSGFRPIEYNVVVKVDVLPEKTEGGLILTEEMHERDQAQINHGVLVAVSPFAFSYEEWPEGSSPPQIGDRVIFDDHAGGKMSIGEDGELYRICKDKQIKSFDFDRGSAT